MRPKAVVFIGNGFTIGLSQYLGIDDWHNTRDLLPPPPWLQAAFGANSAFALWDPRRYPDLWASWHEFEKSVPDEKGRSFHQFAASLAEQPSFALARLEGRPHPVLTFVSKNPGLQLRRYLWHFFFALAHRFVDHLKRTQREDVPGPLEFPRALFHATAQWPLVLALRELAEVWDLTIVSFNYDSYLEQTLQAHGCNLIDVRFHGDSRRISVPRGSVRVIHAHGELATQRQGAGPLAIGDEFFSMTSAMHIMHTDEYNAADHLEFFFPPRPPCPEFPDLVPPGHDESHLLAATSTYRQAIKLFVEQADVIGSIGFSATAPDDKEFQAFLEGARLGTATFAIGRRPSVTTHSSSVLLARVAAQTGHTVFDISEVNQFLIWVRDRFSPALIDANIRFKPHIGELFHLTLQLINRGEIDRAKETLKYFDELDPEIREKAVGLLQNYLEGEAERQAGRPAAALLRYDAAIRAAGHFPAGDSPMAHLYLKMAECYLMTDDGQAARRCIELARPYVPASWSPADEADFDGTEAAILLLEENYAAARELFEKTYRYYLSIKDYPNAAHAKLQSGHTLLQEENFIDAQRAYREAYALYKDRGVRDGEGMSLASLAQAQRQHAVTLSDRTARTAMLRTSIETYGAAIELLETRRENETALALIGLTQSYGLNGDMAAARGALGRARMICESLPLPHLLPTLDHLAGLLQ